MQAEDVICRVRAVIPDATIQVDGEGCSFTITVVSGCFDGMRPVARQQKLMVAFVDVLQSGELHALSIRSWTPEEWQAKQHLVSLG